MSVKDVSSHRSVSLENSGAVAMETEDERTSADVRSHGINYTRRREQEACRNYWMRMYGADAERASRGGVMWFD